MTSGPARVRVRCFRSVERTTTCKQKSSDHDAVWWLPNCGCTAYKSKLVLFATRPKRCNGSINMAAPYAND
ncbi:uncharacterized protein G6M90_00g074750 [Metarhizium brunneum]|uniref:Uncharacterized protein n=1 Tax=Metarhizium brunneum TaxID=500148 RepID=A0A7D5UZ63_9HYPO|nr:hypothetical protein G6M90_00g074750 [Metarhizium brunneum]